MSAGHSHSRRLSKAHPEELKKLMAEPTAAAMLANPPKLVMDKQISDTGGYPVIGNWRYIDIDFVNAVKSGQLKVPGMTAAQILHAVFLHEFLERVLLDADNPIDSYLAAHEFATLFEHTYVRSLGVTPRVYEDAIEPFIKHNETKDLTHPALDLDCAPMIDDPDANDLKSLKMLQGLGVPDASKKSKEKMQYGKSTSNDKCAGCSNWQGARSADLSPCNIVSGAVRLDRWCLAFATMEKDDSEAQQSPSGIQGGGSQDRQGVGNPQSGGGPGGGEPQGIPGSQEIQSAPQPSQGVVNG